MKPKERVQAALHYEIPDGVPRFEVWIDALLNELGQTDTPSAHANLGQDSIMMPSQIPAGSNAWRTGVDEWGRVWVDGHYSHGVVDTDAALEQYTPPLAYAEQFFDAGQVAAVKVHYPDHCLMFGTHVGPFMAGYLAMGFERFFVRMVEDPAFVHKLLKVRADWCIALFQQAASLGAEIIVVGDDAAHGSGPMISPRMWREFVLPYHRRIVDELGVPVIWHSDGNIVPLLPMAVEAGFVGVHGLEPRAGVDLGQVKQAFGKELVLVGNVDVSILCNDSLDAVRGEVDRALRQGAAGGGYMVSTCNSIFNGMNPNAVAEYFRCAAERCQG
jgi:uroporphyrinogen decarboxylase